MFMDKSPRIIYFSLLGIALFTALFYLLLPKEEALSLASYPSISPVVGPVKKSALPKKEEPPLVFSVPDLSKELKLCSVPSRDNPSHTEWRIYANGEWTLVDEGRIILKPSWDKEKSIVGAVEKEDEKGVRITLLFPEIKDVILTETTFFLPKQELAASTELLAKSYIRELQSCKWWGKDRFKEDSSEEQRLQLFSENRSSYLCKITPASFIIYKDKRWQTASSQDEINLYPIARLSDRKLQVWDEIGNFVSLPLQEGALQPIKTPKETLMLTPRLKTLYRITCLFDKTPLALHAGDLAEHREGGWTVLTDAEKEKVLDGYAENDLFYFEGIKKEKGKKILHGYLMNGMRTLKEEVHVPLHQKKEQPSKRKKSTKRES